MAPELESILRTYGLSPSAIQRILVSVDAPRAARAVRAKDNRRAVPTGGDLMRALRSRTGRSLPEVAQMLDVAPSTVSRWESSTAHPTPESLNRYLQIVGASPEERETLLASGVGKVKTNRRPFSATEYQAELDSLEQSLRVGGDGETELRLLKIQSNLWWASEDRSAECLLRRAHNVYAAYLNEWVRFKEALVQSGRTLEYGDPYDEYGIEAQRLQAVATALAGAVPRPHQGLCIIQGCLARVESTSQRVSILIDMADLSHMAGRSSEAESYAERAVSGATGRGSILEAQARGAWATAVGAWEFLRDLPSEPWLACAYRLREYNLHAEGGRKDQAAAVAAELTSLAAEHGLPHFAAKLAFAQKGFTKAAR